MGVIRIGILVSGLDNENSRKLYKGIQHQASLEGYTTFACMIRPSKEANKDSFDGEFSLFKQIEYEKFDALIVALNTFNSKEVKSLILQQCNNISKPVVAIDCDIVNAYKISSSNYEAQRALVEHLINQHGYRKINYVSGPLENDDACTRLRAYEDVMKEHQLYEGKRIYQGSFFLQDGKFGLDYFEATKEATDYEAIVCANDMGALAIIEELENRGKRVPENVAVTGVDDLEMSKSFYPGLTTVSMLDYEAGVLAIKQVQKILEGKKVEEQVDLIPRCVFRGSCGCRVQKYVPVVSMQTQNFTRKVFVAHIIKQFLEESSLVNTFEEFVHVIGRFLELIQQEGFLLCINERYEKIFEQEDIPSFSVPNMLSETRYKAILYKAKENVVEIEIIRSEKKLKNWFHEESKELLSSPIHFRGENFGFFIFEGADFPFMDDNYWEWLNALRTSIHILYNRLQMEDFYRRDSLTNLYNRKGLEHYWRHFTKVSDRRNYEIMVMFLDLDRLKYINDNFGHEQGDFAINAVAHALSEVEPSKCVASRYGGDEFVLIGLNCDLETTKMIKSEIEQKLQLVNRRGIPYEVSASIGYCIRSSDSKLSLDACMKAADENMFAEKCMRHKRRENDI